MKGNDRLLMETIFDIQIKAQTNDIKQMVQQRFVMVAAKNMANDIIERVTGALSANPKERVVTLNVDDLVADSRIKFSQQDLIDQALQLCRTYLPIAGYTLFINHYFSDGENTIHIIKSN